MLQHSEYFKATVPYLFGMLCGGGWAYSNSEVNLLILKAVLFYFVFPSFQKLEKEQLSQTPMLTTKYIWKSIQITDKHLLLAVDTYQLAKLGEAQKCYHSLMTKDWAVE